MPVLPKQPVTFAFGAVDQSRGKRHLPVGALTEAKNVRQIISEQWRKRPGYDRATPTADSGSFTSNAESLTSDELRLISRDASDVHWAENTTANTRVNKGTHKRVLPEIITGQVVPSGKKCTMVVAGSAYWVFTMGSSAYRFYIVDPATRTVTRASTTITATNIINWAVVQDGTYVWVLWVASGSANTTAHRFTITSPGTAPTSTTYSTTNTPTGVDAHRLASGDIAVAVTGSSAAPDQYIRVSYLDTATGQEDATPAGVTTVIRAVNEFISTPSILISDGSNGSWYVATVTDDGLGASTNLHTITATTLATATVVLETVADGGVAFLGWACGYLADNGDRVVYSSFGIMAAAAGTPRPFRLKRHTRAGATTTLELRRYSYPVSKPVKLGSSWYFFTGYDDGTTSKLARSYWLVDSDGKIISNVGGVGNGGAFPQEQGSAADSVAEERTFLSTPQQNQSNRIDVALLFDIGGGGQLDNFGPGIGTCDFAASYSPPTKIYTRSVAVPEGSPTRVGSTDNTRELVPLLFPPPATFGAAGATTHTIQVVYKLVDTDGRVYRSSPNTAQSQANLSSVIVKPLTHMHDGTTAQIEIYISASGQTTPFLHTVLDNDPTVDTQTYAFVAATATGETIYTFGGGLSNSPAPPTRAVWSWRNRIFLASGKDIWPSQELDTAEGPRFSETLISTWEDGEGPILAGAPIDSEACAIFKRDAVGVIAGNGPDGLGNGAYQVRTLRSKKGPINAKSIVTGPGGCYYQALGDGRLYCVTPAAEVLDVSFGIEDYKGETITAAVWDEPNRQLKFYTSGPKILVLDYAHVAEGQPLGRWSYYSSSGLLQAYGAAVDSSGVCWHIEAAGTLRKTGSSWTDATATTPADVFQSVTTGELAVAGQINSEYRLDELIFYGTFVGSHTLTITITSETSDRGTVTTTHPKTVTGGPEHFSVQPGDHDHCISTKVTVEETVGANEGFVLDALTLVVQAWSKAAHISTARRVA